MLSMGLQSFRRRVSWRPLRVDRSALNRNALPPYWSARRAGRLAFVLSMRLQILHSGARLQGKPWARSTPAELLGCRLVTRQCGPLRKYCCMVHSYRFVIQACTTVSVIVALQLVLPGSEAGQAIYPLHPAGTCRIIGSGMQCAFCLYLEPDFFQHMRGGVTRWR